MFMTNKNNRSYTLNEVLLAIKLCEGNSYNCHKCPFSEFGSNCCSELMMQVAIKLQAYDKYLRGVVYEL